ncbi:MAG: DNA polymerase III subunit chi [Accumulibacter sp.]|uniref:DNA polymerase III subunit chi n=1 Tax=Accumulibacter sp. TaxID=2053492 RepID=UPI002FC2E42F
MTRIFFYHNTADRVATAASLIARAVGQKKSLLVYAPDTAVAAALDRHLWLHPPTGFVPHVASDSPLAGETPVVIAGRLDAIDRDERLFNLAPEVPPGFSRFNSLIEIVGQDDEGRIAGRQRARFYRDRGYDIQYFDQGGRV